MLALAGKTPAGAGEPAVTISKETTYITEPLKSDGYPDYIAAMNRRSSQGVTPENNAAVLFWKAMGPGEINKDDRAEYFRMLGMPALPEKGDYFVDLATYLAQQKISTKSAVAQSEPQAKVDARALLEPALKRPWSKREFPQLAAWLAANEKPLALLVEASRRPRRYDPLVCGEKTPLIAVCLPNIQCERDVGRALITRAMLRLDEGRSVETWEDLLTLHRLARLAADDPGLIENLVARAQEELACAGDQALLQYARLDDALLAKIRDDLSRLAPMPPMAEKINVAERFVYLDIVLHHAQKGPASLTESLKWLEAVGQIGNVNQEELTKSIELKNTFKSLIRYSASTAIDWDDILRSSNTWFDQIVDAYRKPTRFEQQQSLAIVEKEFRRLKKRARDTNSLDEAMRRDPRKAFSQRFSQVLLAQFAPNLWHCSEAQDRGAMQLALVKLAFALAAYHTDVGSYPARLADLVPKYVAKVPKDFFNDAELHYRLEGTGFVLYSVGVNGKDDGTKSYEDRKQDEGWDDLVVRVPGDSLGNRNR